MILHIIIPVHNNLNLTIKCLEHIKNIESIDYKIYIIDDGSTDGTSSWVSTNRPDINLIVGDGSLWWTGAIHLGVIEVLRIANNNDYIMSLNNDVFLQKNTLNELIYFSNNQNRKCICNALSVDEFDGRIISSGSRVLSWFFNLNYHPLHNKNIQSIDSFYPIEVDMLTGRCVLYPVEVFSLVGNFDYLRFPHYGGDSEFTIRAKRNGYALYIIPRSIALVNNENTGLNSMAIKLSYKEKLLSLFIIRSSSNLKYRTRFALHVPPIYARPSYFLIMVLKIFTQIFLGNFFVFKKVPKL